MIKLRAWRKSQLEKGKLFKYEQYQTEDDCYFLYMTPGGLESIWQFTDLMCDDDWIVEQFTGIYDATKWEELTKQEQDSFLAAGHMKEDWKGKEIYEGDIVKQNFYKYSGNLSGDGDGLSIEGFHQGQVKIYPSKGVVISPCYTEFDEEMTSEHAYKKPRVQYGVKVISKRCKIISNIHENKINERV